MANTVAEDSDKSGFQEFVDACEMRVIVAASYPHHPIDILANRSVKRSTMLAAVSADGSCLKPMIMIQHKAYEVDHFEAGFARTSDLNVQCDAVGAGMTSRYREGAVTWAFEFLLRLDSDSYRDYHLNFLCVESGEDLQRYRKARGSLCRAEVRDGIA
jgi:hypothetical protein